MEIPAELLQKKILIVDDASSMRKLTKAILREGGFTHVFEAEDGQTALALLKKVKVNLVICDWNMPVMSGMELFLAAKADADLSTIPFIMLTSSSEGTKVKEAIVAGITAYMIKPFKPVDLIAKVVSKLT
ncbi:MAG: response regulator [Methylobacter sp.]|jgi:two-component system chemotaxis response regulator CheY|uniref:response regulator n=1 Tax=Methylobacter sp. TaxID=2051955 RepID=UPI00258B99A4|nr:response regulator [Methylobacter sp.]MCL7420871.1 response regulator [Methylobacter sp.]